MKKSILDCRNIPIEYTKGQVQALLKIERFMNSTEKFFLLAGYSGCGKTTIAENIARYTNAILLAPTNAAVNRLRDKIDGKFTFKTIHLEMYVPSDEDGFVLDVGLKVNQTYIIDECSMIDDYILNDIITQAKKNNCKIIFIGDSFQLEPVGQDPLLFAWEKRRPDDFQPENKYELSEVKRYDGDLLKIATDIRTDYKNLKPSIIKINKPDSNDLLLEKKFTSAILKDIRDNNSYVVLTSTNQKRVSYNNKIRSVKYKTNDNLKYLQLNDILVSVSNNRFYSNGETFFVNNASLISEFKIKIPDFKKDELSEYDALLYKHNNKLILLIPDLLEPSLHGHQLFKAYDNELFDVPEHVEQMCFLINNKKVIYGFNKNVIIATYGYAISCHKAQGQEWDNVYIDADWLMPVWNAARWFYTAITRAKYKVQIKENKYFKLS